MPKFPYTATITAKVVNGDGSTTFTYQVKDGNGVVKQTQNVTVIASDTLANGVASMKHSVAFSIFNDLAAADVPVGTVLSWNVADVVS